MPKHLVKEGVALQKRSPNGLFSHWKEKKKKTHDMIIAEKGPLHSMTFFWGSSTSGAWFSHRLNVAAALPSSRVSSVPLPRRERFAGFQPGLRCPCRAAGPLKGAKTLPFAVARAASATADWFTASGSSDLETWARQNAPGAVAGLRTGSCRVTSEGDKWGTRCPRASQGLCRRGHERRKSLALSEAFPWAKFPEINVNLLLPAAIRERT